MSDRSSRDLLKFLLTGNSAGLVLSVFQDGSVQCQETAVYLGVRLDERDCLKKDGCDLTHRTDTV